MAKLKLLVTDNIDRSGLTPLYNYFDIDSQIGLKENGLKKIIGQYYCVITRTSTAFPKDIIDASLNLKIIARAAIGIDNIDIGYATKKKIAVINAPKGNARSTAEHTIGLIIALLRHIPQAVNDLKNGIWGKTKYIGIQYLGKTLGIVGFGNVGKEVYRLAKGMGMNVIVCEPYIRMPKSITQVTYEELLSQSDIISFHVPGTYLTKHMLNRSTLTLCKDGIFIINCSRGAVIDEVSLLNQIKSGKIAGLALDVFTNEPNVNQDILNFPNVIATPHIAGSTLESQRESVHEVVNGILQYIKGVAPSNLLNPQVFQKRKVASYNRKLDFDAVILDCDSTISAIEGIDELASFHGIKMVVSLLTRQAMEGKLAFEDIFQKRLDMIKPSRSDLEKLGDLYVKNLTEDVIETIQALKLLNKKIYLVSSSYTPALLKIAVKLGIPDKQIFANDLIFNTNGSYQRFIEGPLKRNNGKLQIVRQIPGRKVFIGDGITDLETRELVDLFIGFGGFAKREIVEAESDIYIYCKSMTPILVLVAGISGCMKLLKTPYRKFIGKGLDLLSHPKHTKIKNHHKYILTDFKKLAYY